MTGRFTGFPRDAFTFFRDIERYNKREWFQPRKELYERVCLAPMQALVAELDPFGPSRISRIYRDVRFSADKSPYKTNISAGVAGVYLILSADGLWAGGGIYKPDSARLLRLRVAIGDEQSGRQLQRIVASLRRKGYDVGTHEMLRSAPKGFAADHPRLELLRMKDMYAGKQFAADATLSTRKAIVRVKQVMKDLAPFNAWLRQYTR
jgi:uncharacterized protein (TIGR02453 family)